MPEHIHTTEQLYHESELLSQTLTDVQSRLRSLEERIDDIETPASNDSKFTLQDIEQLSITVESLCGMVGTLAEDAGYEVTKEGNKTIVSGGK